MRLLNTIRRRNGFTLVELLVAIALFGIMMVAFLSLFLTAVSLTIRSGNKDNTVADIAGGIERNMASETYINPAVTTSPDTFTMRFAEGTPDATSEPVNVEITTGKATNSDGITVEINSYETAGSP